MVKLGGVNVGYEYSEEKVKRLIKRYTTLEESYNDILKFNGNEEESLKLLFSVYICTNPMFLNAYTNLD